jgi:hypothetical protein
MKIFQIFYDNLTKNKLDNCFIPFDNSNSLSRDWYEYSVIREIFKKHSFDKEEYIGILSPRFFEKTGMKGIDVLNVIKKSSSDIISFSPRFDQIAYFKNSFYQGNFHHKGLFDLSKRVFSELGLQVNLDTLVADQTRTIYANFFVAKYSFWEKYLSISEQIFEISNGSSEIAGLLNTKVFHRNFNNYTYKIFLMERLITVVLELENINSEIGFDYIKSVQHLKNVKPILGDLMMLDSFKTAFLQTKKSEYMNLYQSQRKRIPLIEILYGKSR